MTRSEQRVKQLEAGVEAMAISSTDSKTVEMAIDLLHTDSEPETVPTEAAKREMPPMNESEGFPECDCGVGTKHFNFFCHTLKCAYRSAVAASWKKINAEIKAELVATPSPMNSESETVEERAAKWLYELGFEKYESTPPPKLIAMFASSLLQEKEQSYKYEREAQREFYLPLNPTAEDISQARAIIAQQKSKLFEKEQRIKELEARLDTE